MSSNLNAEDEFPNQLSSVEDRLNSEQRHRLNLWRSNYHEASIYIEEGLNNDKFENHPRKRATRRSNLIAEANDQASNCNQSAHATPLITDFAGPQETDNPFFDEASSNKSSQQKQQQQKSAYLLGGQYTTIETYILVHNRYFYQLDLLASILLMLLAFVEPPAVDGIALDTSIHAAIEMFALGVIAIELLLKFRWMGPKRFFRHGRTVTKLIVLLTMNLEAIIIFMRKSTHSRYSRALRPIFLIDNHYLHGLRRAVRQIFQSLPPILDMFTLSLFFMFVFSIFGFYLFAPTNSYFSDMPTTVGNLLILATTANMPDMMMPSYDQTRWSAIYFVLFIIVHLFLLTNLTLAAVYESFTRKEKEKFHKLLLHRRKACKEAFKLLVSRRQPNRIQYRQFMGLMRYLNRKCSMFDAYLIFKALDSDRNGSLSLEEFYQIYDFINLDWKLIHPMSRWYEGNRCVPKFANYPLRVVTKIVCHRYFEWFIDFLIALAALLQFAEATAFDFNHPTMKLPTGTINIPLSPLQVSQNEAPSPDKMSTSIFIIVFMIEAFLKCLGLGISEYWVSRWNRFDLCVLLISIAGSFIGYVDGKPYGWLVVIRVMRLIRLFEFKRRYKDMWQTLTYILLKRFVSMTCVVIILYYFFAIIGMELLGDYDLRNCCQNTTLESQFRYDNSTQNSRYYLNDFGDVLASYLTLFSMNSNTYWLATMTAYAIVAETNLVRIFFGLYYLCSIIVMNIVIAFILESFLFRINYRNKMGNNCDETNLFTIRVALSPTEIEFLSKTLGATGISDKNLIVALKAIARQETNRPDDNGDEESALLVKDIPTVTVRKPSQSSSDVSHELDQPSRPSEAISLGSSDGFFLIFQAEQIRNKFSFTMKMYADEVEGWLAEAEREDRGSMSQAISRNQIRAEHVAMARLVRRTISDLNNEPHRGRSWSSSSGVVRERQKVSESDSQQGPKSPNKKVNQERK